MAAWLPYTFATVRRIVAVSSLTLILTACGGTAAPMAPSAIEQASSDVSAMSTPATFVATRRTLNTFPLVNGSFVLTLAAADGTAGTVNGTYTGEVVVSEHGHAAAALVMHITSTSGIGSTITAIEAEGTRAFVGEGDFALSLRLTSSLTKSSLRVTARGTSRVSCSASHRILVTLQGTDSTRGFLEITADLQHEVEQTACL